MGNKPSLIILPDFVDASEQLMVLLRDDVVWDERMKARKTASFGVSYDYSGITYPQCDMHPALLSIVENIEQSIGFKPNNCLLNFYPDGKSSMGYHSDSSEELLPGTGVAIVSLGASRMINYKNKADKTIVHQYLLDSGTLLYMDNQVQEDWLHAIPKQVDAGERISLTFRHILK